MNTTKNPMPFHKLEGTVWTNYKTLWHKNSAYCEGSIKRAQVYYPGVHHFQLPMESTSTVTDMAVRKSSDNTEVAGLVLNYKVYYDSDGKRYLLINVDLISALIGDSYYVSVETSAGFYYSEIFCLDNNQKDRLALIYASDCRAGSMVYKNGFKHVINLDARLVMGEVQIEEDIEENGFGEETPTLQTLNQSYSCSCLVPNYIAEALTALKLHNQFRFIDYFNSVPFVDDFDPEVISVNATASPEVDGCNSFVEITFKTRSIVNDACCDEIFEDLFSTPGAVVLIYDQGSEWQFSVVGSENVDSQNSEDPSSPPNSIKFDAAFEGQGIFFTNPVQVPADGIKLSFDFKLNAIHGYNLVIRTYNDDTGEFGFGYVNGTKYGVDPNILTYQNVEIPMSDFGLSHFTQISFYVGQGTNNFIHYYTIDNIKLSEV